MVCLVEDERLTVQHDGRYCHCSHLIVPDLPGSALLALHLPNVVQITWDLQYIIINVRVPTCCLLM